MTDETKIELLGLGNWIEKQFRLGTLPKIGKVGAAETIYWEICRRLGEAQEPAAPKPKPEDCTHEQFAAVVAVARVLDVGEFVAEVKINCVACAVAMRFKGVPAGLNYRAPTVTIDGIELHAPVEPEYEKKLQASASFESKQPPIVN